MYWITPITNRQQSDVDRVIYLNTVVQNNTATRDELIEWKSFLPGAFNEEDMFRILYNLSILDIILETELDVPDLELFPTTEWFSKLLYCVGVIRDAYMHYVETPVVPQLPVNHYTKFNDIEQILLDVYTIISNNFFHYCGEQFYAGDEIGMLL